VRKLGVAAPHPSCEQKKDGSEGGERRGRRIPTRL
jgi:hypothetical protein